MLANRLLGILPELTEQQAIETAAISSLGKNNINLTHWRQRPFRQPHHTASSAALVGGGNPPLPGEASLAHNGILFLDELPEFPRHVLDSLREPLESGCIDIARATHHIQFPAKFQLIAAMNPCPCGHYANPNGECRCTRHQLQRYHHRLSGPFLDRIDIHLQVPALPPTTLTTIPNNNNPTSSELKQLVCAARKLQLTRQQKLNNQLNAADLGKYCHLGKEQTKFITRAIEKMRLSARAYHRVLRSARTIADLAQKSEIEINHLSEALSYRHIDILVI